MERIYVIDVMLAKKNGNEQLKNKISSISREFVYEETAYHLPVSFALTGIAVHDQKSAADVFTRTNNNPLVAAECLLAAATAAEGKEPAPYTGFISDTVIRKLGYSLVDGSILGLALIVGTPKSAGTAAAICRELQEKYMLTFLAGGVIPSLSSSGVKLGLDYRLIPLGSKPLHSVYFVDIIARVAMMFGGVSPGDTHRLLAYAAERAKAIVVVFPGLSDEDVAFIDGMRVLGFPILSLDDYKGGDWTPSTPEEIVPHRHGHERDQGYGDRNSHTYGMFSRV